MFNGRTNLIGPNINNKFNMMDRIPITNTTYQNVITGTFEQTLLSNTYFSKKNIDIVHNIIRKGVYDKSDSKLIIGPQNLESLVQIMRSFFLQYSKNLQTNIREQIEELNKYVIDFAVNQIYNEAIAYIKYKENVSTMHKPIDRPIYSSTKSKSLEFKYGF